MQKSNRLLIASECFCFYSVINNHIYFLLILHFICIIVNNNKYKNEYFDSNILFYNNTKIYILTSHTDAINGVSMGWSYMFFDQWQAWGMVLTVVLFALPFVIDCFIRFSKSDRILDCNSCIV